MTSPKSTRIHLTIAKKVKILDLIQTGKFACLTNLTCHTEEDEDEAEDETISITPVCSFADAKKYIEEICRFFKSIDCTHKPT